MLTRLKGITNNNNIKLEKEVGYNEMKIDLGCGKFKKLGYVGVDLIDYSKLYPEGMFIKHDLNKALPFKDNAIDKIFCKETLEELSSMNNIKNEIYRVLKPNGVLEVIVPHFSGASAYNEVHHYLFRYNAFFNGILDNKRFITLSKKITFYKGRHIFGYLKEWLFNKFPKFYENSFLRNIFPAWQIYGRFKKR